jgi:alpha-amylase/alpha-mannosidase (GH57 family)
MKNEAFSRGTQCKPHEAMFDSPMEVGLKISCLPCANILHLLTEEELAAIPTSVEQSGENVRYVDGTNTEINEDIYKTQELGSIALIVTLQQERLKGNSEGNNTVMMMKKRKTFKKSSTKQMLMRKICCQTQYGVFLCRRQEHIHITYQHNHKKSFVEQIQGVS